MTNNTVPRQTEDGDSEFTLRLSFDAEMKFRRIAACPAGFLMGSRNKDADEEPAHHVVITEDFWMSETPVTQAQFDVWTKLHRIEHAYHFSGNPDHPAETMTWHQATDFCRWLADTHASRFPQGIRFAELPCEARWEYACRAGSATDYHTGDGDAALREAGWYGEDLTTGTTHPCGSKRANKFGLFDMHGNVWEWCLDRWDASGYRRRWEGITDRETFQMNEESGDRSENSYRVLRGGSYWNSAFGCRSAYRVRNWAGVRIRFIGFRVCLVRSPLFSQTGEAEPERTALERRDEATGAGSDGEAEILNPSSPGSARGRGRTRERESADNID